MADLTLKDLIRLEEPNVDNLKIKIARHVMKGRGWEGFDDLIRFDDDLFLESSFLFSCKKLMLSL